MKFSYVSGRRCLDFAGTLRFRASAREELLTSPERLSDWAVQAELVDAVPEITDDELASVTQPVGLLPSVPDNPFHQRRTVDALHRLLPHAVEMPGCPEPPRPDFPPHAESFIDAVASFALMR